MSESNCDSSRPNTIRIYVLYNNANANLNSVKDVGQRWLDDVILKPALTTTYAAAFQKS